MFRKISFFFILILFIKISAVSAIKPDSAELSHAKRIEFINFKGAALTHTAEAELRGIGIFLAGEHNAITRSYFNKYSVKRLYDSTDTLKLSADIITLSSKARVNHIIALRKIISGYCSAAYGYSIKEADTAAVIITYYNALYRGDMGYLSGRYQKIVMAELLPVNAGLSTKYWEWPGRTKIIIPLSGTASGGKPDIFAAADDTVINQMKQKDDRSVELRREIVLLKEDQLKREKDLVKKEKDAVAAAKELIAGKEAALVEKKKTAEKESRQIEQEKQRAGGIKNPAEAEKAQENIIKKEKSTLAAAEDLKKEEAGIAAEKNNAAQNERELVKKENQLADKENKLSEEKKELVKDTDKTEKTAEKKAEPADKVKKEKTDLVKEKEQIAIKKKELEKKEEELTARTDKVFKDKFYYLKINNYFNDGFYNNELFIINPASGKTTLKSPYGTIAGRKYDIFAAGVVIIGYEGKGNFDHRLVLLHPDTLLPTAKSSDIIFWRSFIEIRDSLIYTVLSDNGKFYLARYDESLKRVARSDKEVDKDSAVSFYGENIYLNAPDKKILVLNKKDLSYIKTIDPEKDVEKEVK